MSNHVHEVFSDASRKAHMQPRVLTENQLREWGDAAAATAQDLSDNDDDGEGE